MKLLNKNEMNKIAGGLFEECHADDMTGPAHLECEVNIDGKTKNVKFVWHTQFTKGIV